MNNWNELVNIAHHHDNGETLRHSGVGMGRWRFWGHATPLWIDREATDRLVGLPGSNLVDSRNSYRDLATDNVVRLVPLAFLCLHIRIFSAWRCSSAFSFFPLDSHRHGVVLWCMWMHL